MNKIENKNDLIVAFAVKCPVHLREHATSFRQNQHIGYAAAQNARALNRCAVYTQWSIIVPTHGLQVIFTPEEPGQIASVDEMARHLVETAKEFGTKKIWVAAAAPELERCMRKVKQAAEKIKFPVEVYACKMETKPAEYWIIRDPTSVAAKQPSRWNIFTWFSKRFSQKTAIE